MPTPPRAFKDALYEQLAQVGKALANPHRLELLDLLCQAPRTVEALAEETSMTLSNTSQHLHVLRQGGLLSAQKQGLFVTYQLSSDAVRDLYLSLRGVAEVRLAEIDRLKRDYFAERGALTPIGREELRERMRKGEIVLIDVRPRPEYEGGHLPGALSIPVAELERRLGELPRDKTIVAYCRGPYCVFAIDATQVLEQHGFSAIHLEEGVLEWGKAGLPISFDEGGLA